MTKPPPFSFSRRSLMVAAALTAAARAHAQTKVLAPVVPSEAPLSLTASDGAGLTLVSMTAKVVVEGPLAFTELHLAFSNPEDRVREGRFRITLPQNAAVSRFAMKIADRWQEGEVVELQAARVAYEDFLHRRQDPALLETEAGNEFSARVFPIPPRATKELVVSYSQELVRQNEPYRLPLRGLPKLGGLSIRALVARTDGGGQASSLGGKVARHEVVEVDKQGFVPDRDFEVPARAPGGRIGLRHENLVVARVKPLGGDAQPDPVRKLSIFVDTSASRALGWAAQVARVDALLGALGKTEVVVTAFDQEIVSVAQGAAEAVRADVRKRLDERRALGASDLEAALRAAAGKGRAAPRVLFVTDGVATAGTQANDKLAAATKALAAAGVERLDVLAIGGIRDDERLHKLVTAGLQRAGLVIDDDAPVEEINRRLNQATRSGLAVEVEGASWVWPQKFDGVQPGDERLVYADLPADRPFRLRIGGKDVGEGTLSPTERPLLERAWVKARIARVMAQKDALAADADLAAALQKQVIELSTKHRVLSPYTALLVLETEDDYRRFGIERRALADILTVGAGGLAVVQRREPVLVAASAPRDGQEIARVSKGRADVPAPKAKSASAERKIIEEGRGGTLRGVPGGTVGGVPGGTVGGVRAAESRGVAGGSAANATRRPPMDDALSGLDLGAGSAASDRARAFSAPTSRAPAASAPAPEPREQASARQMPAAPPPPRPQREIAARAESDAVSSSRDEAEAPAMRRRAAPASRPIERVPPREAPYEGQLAEVMGLIARGQQAAALERALAWRARDPGDVLALVALGEAAESRGNFALAARAYGSIIDLFPGRADMRRFAGNRLERLRAAATLALAIDTYRKAAEQRPDHPASHRLLAFALLRQGAAVQAFEALTAAVKQTYPSGRFAGVDRILREDLGLAAAAWRKAAPERAGEIDRRLAALGGVAERGPSIRFVLTWETDANDVDFHIHDGRGGHAYYSQPRLQSGGELYADVTTGYGPECFTVRGQARAYPYKLQAHYYRRGPMGYGMGKLQILDHDGQGGLRFEDRPFVVMKDGAFVDLGVVKSAPAGLVLAR